MLLAVLSIIKLYERKIQINLIIRILCIADVFQCKYCTHRFKKLCQRSEPCQYVTCHIEGTLRKSDRACRGYNRCCQMVRRARARGDNPCSSGNDIVSQWLVFLRFLKRKEAKVCNRTSRWLASEVLDFQLSARIALPAAHSSCM